MIGNQHPIGLVASIGPAADLELDDTERRIVELERSLARSRAELEAARKELRAQLAESRRLAAIVASSNDAIIGMNLDGSILSFNSGAQRIYGYSAREMLGRSIRLLLPADRYGEIAEIVDRLRQGETIDHFKSRRVRKDGQVLTVSVCISPIVDEAGRLIGASSIARVVADPEQLGGIVRLRSRGAGNLPEASCIVRMRDRTVVYANEPFQQIFACERSEVLGQTFDSLIGQDDGPSRSIFDTMLTTLREAGTWIGEIQSARHSAGHYRCQASLSGKSAADHALIRITIQAGQTERRRVESALRVNEERLRLAVEATGMGIWYCHLADGMRMEWSARFKEIWGLAPDADITQERVRNLIHPADVDAVEHVWRRSLEPDGDGRFIVEHRVCRPDGAVAWVMAWGRTCFDALGRPQYSTGIAVDITERKRAEKETRESQDRLQLIADSLPILIAYVDTEWRFQFNNAAFEQWHATPRAAFKGHHLREILAPDIFATVAPHVELALAGQPQVFESRFRYRDGKVRDVQIHDIPHRDEHGNVLGFFVMTLDISERRRMEDALRENEDRLRAIVLTAADAIITCDERGIIESVNPATERMFGYNASAMIGQPIDSVLVAPSDSRTRGDGAGPSGSCSEGLGRRSDGSLFPLEMTVSAPGRFRHVTAILRDITRRRALQREVLDIATLEQRRIGQELHDNIGQELTALGLLAQTLVDVTNQGEASVCTLSTKIAVGLKRALAQIRLLSRGLIPVEVDAAGLMAALKDLARRSDGLQGVQCVFARRDRVLVENNQTATHLYRIAQEAVANALRHSEGRHITIVLEEHDQTIVLQVSDDGRGLPPHRDGNEGMGLKIMGYRAGLINAQLSIEPAEPTGTVVRCNLPKV